jgi:hypothetical protein
MQNLKVKEIEMEALSLPFNDRVYLAERLVSSLDEREYPDFEHSWLIEAEKRYKKYRAENLQGKLAENVFRDAFSKIT